MLSIGLANSYLDSFHFHMIQTNVTTVQMHKMIHYFSSLQIQIYFTDCRHTLQKWIIFCNTPLMLNYFRNMIMVVCMDRWMVFGLHRN